ncbi:hypothetical protein BGX23_012725 [Mortierella sp. AD031]|nr:hypothetical protein BGX23_012725 [Mortierella sp. AD031]
MTTSRLLEQQRQQIHQNSRGRCQQQRSKDSNWENERKTKKCEQRQEIAGWLMGQARGLAEARLSEKVRHAVITTPSFSSGSYPQPETTTEVATRTGLYPVKILDQSEAAVLAYEHLIAQAEQAENGRPQTIVMYYLNEATEGMSAFESYRAESEQFLRLKSVAKYHFYQSVQERLMRTLAERLYDKYTQGSISRHTSLVSTTWKLLRFRLILYARAKR